MPHSGNPGKYHTPRTGVSLLLTLRLDGTILLCELQNPVVVVFNVALMLPIKWPQLYNFGVTSP